MEHLAQDLSLALEESEPGVPVKFKSAKKWGMKRRTRSAGDLNTCHNKQSVNRSDDSSSSNSGIRMDEVRTKVSSLHQSDSDDMIQIAVARTMGNNHSLRMKSNIDNFLKVQERIGGFGKSLSYSLESDSVNENSPARPSLRKKRKLKRMCIDEVPVPPGGKRKRPQRLDPHCVESFRCLRDTSKIKPLNPSIVEKIEKFCQHSSCEDHNMSMETQYVNDSCEVASESSLSWSGGEGHEGDDELTDWAPSHESTSTYETLDIDPREIRAGCRRLRDERKSFSISTGVNERVARFLQDSARSEMRLYGIEHEKLGQLATLYSLELWYEGSSSLLKKTSRTPCMQPPQRHYTGFSTGHKRIRTHESRPP